jgi:hypothetical protein
VLGASWARALLERTRDEGRPVDGGWPGTLPEARALVSTQLNRELSERAMPVLSASELSAAVTTTYSRAKRDWLAVAQATRHNELRRAR